MAMLTLNYKRMEKHINKQDLMHATKTKIVLIHLLKGNRPQPLINVGGFICQCFECKPDLFVLEGVFLNRKYIPIDECDWAPVAQCTNQRVRGLMSTPCSPKMLPQALIGL